MIAEMIRCADESMRVVSIAAGLTGHMGSMNKSIHQKVSAFMADSSMPMISTSVRYMNDLVKMMVANKKRNVFADQSVMQEVFREIKEGNAYSDQLVQRQVEAEMQLL